MNCVAEDTVLTLAMDYSTVYLGQDPIDVMRITYSRVAIGVRLVNQ